jgi:hypothetical protein
MLCIKNNFIPVPRASISKEFSLVYSDGGNKLSRRSKKEKTEGIEKHKQALREKKQKKKEKKKVSIPANYRKK